MDKLTKTAGAKLTASVYRRLEERAAADGKPVSEYVRALIIKDLTAPDGDLRFVAWLVCGLEQLFHGVMAAPLQGEKVSMKGLDRLRQVAIETAGGLLQLRWQEFQGPTKTGKA